MENRIRPGRPSSHRSDAYFYYGCENMARAPSGPVTSALRNRRQNFFYGARAGMFADSRAALGRFVDVASISRQISAARSAGALGVDEELIDYTWSIIRERAPTRKNAAVADAHRQGAHPFRSKPTTTKGGRRAARPSAAPIPANQATGAGHHWKIHG